MAGFFSASLDPTQPDSADAIARRRQLADALMRQGMDSSPIQSWTQGAARLANVLAGKVQNARADRADRESGKELSGLMAALMGNSGQSAPSAPSAAPVAAPAGGGSNYRDAIASIESRGSGDYSAVGPTHPKMGRALGRYQVMETNIGPWSREALGREVTADEFLRNPQIQDAIFDHRFGGYVQKFGNPQDAASAWFTGRPLAQGANARDVLGTTGSAYVQEFNRALGAGANPADRPAPGAANAGGAVPGQDGFFVPPGAAPAPVRVAETEEDVARMEGSMPPDPSMLDPNMVMPGQAPLQNFSAIPGSVLPMAQGMVPSADMPARGAVPAAAAGLPANPPMPPQRPQIAPQMAPQAAPMAQAPNPFLAVDASAPDGGAMAFTLADAEARRAQGAPSPLAGLVEAITGRSASQGASGPVPAPPSPAGPGGNAIAQAMAAPAQGGGMPQDPRAVMASILANPRFNDRQKAMAMQAYQMMAKTEQPRAGVVVNGRLVDPVTGQVRADYSNMPGNRPELSLTPQYGVDKDGNPVIIQIGKDGKAVQTKLPDGVSLSREPIRVDAGTETVLLDPVTRQPISRIPKNLAQAEAEKGKGKAQAEAAANLPTDLATGEQAIRELDALISHPGLSQIAGPLDQFRPSWGMGGEGRDALARFNQAKGRAFLQAFGMLKGGGQITEVEGLKAEQAMARMDRALDEREFKQALTDFRDAVKTGMEKMRERAGQAALAPAAPAPSGGPRIISVEPVR